MRHRVAGYKLSRDAEDRRALRRNLAAALFTHGEITTTPAKARMVRPFVEKMITLARKGDLASRRRVLSALQDRVVVAKGIDDPDVKRNKYGEIRTGPKLVHKLFSEIAPRYQDRPGGYTRIIKLAKHRIADGGDQCVLQLVGTEEVGPQVAGQYSRRRNKANRRMDFSAKLRKAKSDQAAPADEAPPAAQAPAADESKAPQAK
jgi:large subunit ribosomal protein L17